MVYRLDASEIGGKRLGIGVGELAVAVIRHHRCKDPSIRPNACAHGFDDIRLAPGPDTRFRFRSEIRRIEGAEPWDLEADFRPAEVALRIRLPLNRAGSVAPAAIHDGGKI